jgi:hypothetical protein
VITIADLRAHDDPILALTMGGIRTSSWWSSFGAARAATTSRENACIKASARVRKLGSFSTSASAAWTIPSRFRDAERAIVQLATFRVVECVLEVLQVCVMHGDDSGLFDAPCPCLVRRAEPLLVGDAMIASVLSGVRAELHHASEKSAEERSESKGDDGIHHVVLGLS